MIDEQERQSLEEELSGIEDYLKELYEADNRVKPFVDDAIRHEIYDQQRRREELKIRLNEPFIPDF